MAKPEVRDIRASVINLLGKHIKNDHTNAIGLHPDLTPEQDDALKLMCTISPQVLLGFTMEQDGLSVVTSLMDRQIAYFISWEKVKEYREMLDAKTEIPSAFLRD